MWMWFATMYLTHHYMIDLVGGSIYAIVTFAIAQTFLPKVSYSTRLKYLGIPFSLSSLVYSIEHDTVRTKEDEEMLIKDDTSLYSFEPSTPTTPRSPTMVEFKL